MYLSLYVSVQNEVKRIVFTKPLYAVSLYGYFACFVQFRMFSLLYTSLYLAILGTYCPYASLISFFYMQLTFTPHEIIRVLYS